MFFFLADRRAGGYVGVLRTMCMDFLCVRARCGLHTRYQEGVCRRLLKGRVFSRTWVDGLTDIRDRLRRGDDDGYFTRENGKGEIGPWRYYYTTHIYDTGLRFLPISGIDLATRNEMDIRTDLQGVITLAPLVYFPCPFLFSSRLYACLLAFAGPHLSTAKKTICAQHCMYVMIDHQPFKDAKRVV